MLNTIIPFLAAILVPGGSTFPYPFTNSTSPRNGTFSNATLPNSNNTGVIQYKCQYMFPTDLTVLNERYPDYNVSRLHDASRLFMLRRQVPEEGEIATRAQFQGLPSNVSNTTCRLEFILPKLQTVEGFNPTFNVYQVERDTDTISTWKNYVGYNDAKLFGKVNGEPEALERTRTIGAGTAAIGETRCNETLTFQMGMAFNSREGVPNYWEFVEVTPPAWPVQGFRMVWGC